MGGKEGMTVGSKEMLVELGEEEMEEGRGTSDR
jgi:hypothetical protein